MRSFDCLTITVTNKCPLKCRHCGPASGPGESDIIHNDYVRSVLNEARQMNCKMVNFSGGEPFVIGNKLTDYVAMASKRDLLTRITTGAYWSTSRKNSKKRLKPMAKAGLKQLFISYSQAHQEFVSLEYISAAVSAAQDLGIKSFLSVGTCKNSRGLIPGILKHFESRQVMVPPIIESPIIPAGRASAHYSKNSLNLKRVELFSGPCPSLTEHPTIHADGKVTGCAVVFGRDCPPLCFGNLNESSFPEILDRMHNSPLAAWIHKIGVVELKQFIEANTNISFEDRYVNICHLCGDIMHNREALAFLAEMGFLDHVSIDEEA